MSLSLSLTLPSFVHFLSAFFCLYENSVVRSANSTRTPPRACVAFLPYNTKGLSSKRGEKIHAKMRRAALVLQTLGRRTLSTTTPARGGGGLYVHRDTPENNPQTPFKFTEESMKRVCRCCHNEPSTPALRSKRFWTNFPTATSPAHVCLCSTWRSDNMDGCQSAR